MVLTGAVPIKIDSFDDLSRYENEIIERINRFPNGGNLFMINPFLLFADIGVEISDKAREEIISLEPHLSTLSVTPYNALRNSRERQKIRFHIHGLFRRTQV